MAGTAARAVEHPAEHPRRRKRTGGTGRGRTAAGRTAGRDGSPAHPVSSSRAP